MNSKGLNKLQMVDWPFIEEQVCENCRVRFAIRLVHLTAGKFLCDGCRSKKAAIDRTVRTEP